MPNRIRELRKEHHMTQVRLSVELEVAQETISAYENQKHYPSFLQLTRMSELFHASIDYIMGLSDIRNPVDMGGDENLQQLLSLILRLDKKQVELVIAYTQGVIDMTK